MISRRSLNIILAVVGVVVLLSTARLLYDWALDDGEFPTGHFSPHIIDDLDATSTSFSHPDRDPICDGFPDTSGILLVMKTGATESFDKVPMQLMTVLRCLPDFLIFSDLEQRIAGNQVRDSLDTVLAEARDGNSDFDLYRQQQACEIDQDKCVKTVDGPKDAGWKLDKYKNIHMAEKAYEVRPGYDWYFFIDADTYVSWPNLVQMLRKLDPAKERYLGSVAMLGGMPFGHGGSGYAVSGAAMKELAKHPGVANNFDVRTKDECCGDYMFAIALNDTIGVTVEGIWPTINGEKPSTLPFGPKQWCHPIATMHHMNSEEISEFWEFEHRRSANDQRPLVFKDVYHRYLEPKLVEMREDWDNHSDDWFYIDFDAKDRAWEDWRVDRAVEDKEKSELEKKAHESFDDCARACEAHDECFQFGWKDNCCGMKRSFVLGWPVKKEKVERKRTKSGWDIAKINDWVKDQGDCKRVIWPEVGS